MSVIHTSIKEIEDMGCEYTQTEAWRDLDGGILVRHAESLEDFWRAGSAARMFREWQPRNARNKNGVSPLMAVTLERSRWFMPKSPRQVHCYAECDVIIVDVKPEKLIPESEENYDG